MIGEEEWLSKTAAGEDELVRGTDSIRTSDELGAALGAADAGEELDAADTEDELDVDDLGLGSGDAGDELL